MSTTAPRPGGVTVAAVLLFLSAAVSIVGGVLSMFAAAAGSSATVDGTVVTGATFPVLGVILLVLGALNLVFAFGILRGSRVVRMIVTILQLLTVISGISAFFVPGGVTWQGIIQSLLPLVIVSLLWSGAGTKAFFARS